MALKLTQIQKIAKMRGIRRDNSEPIDIPVASMNFSVTYGTDEPLCLQVALSRQRQPVSDKFLLTFAPDSNNIWRNSDALKVGGFTGSIEGVFIYHPLHSEPMMHMDLNSTVMTTQFDTLSFDAGAIAIADSTLQFFDLPKQYVIDEEQELTDV